jgi:transcription termination/antitermination protein NusA
VSNLDMSEAIGMLAQEKGISEDALLHVLVDALASAYKRRPDAADEVVVEVNPETMEFSFIAYDVDEDGNWVNERDDTPKKEELGRIAAQTFRQVMSQRIREVESERKFEEYANREGDIVTGIIQRTDARYTLLDLGRVEALLPQAEQVPFERPAQGDRQKAYIVEVRRTPKGPQIVVSRTHPGLIKRLFELEVPEIADGIVEIKACAREPGHRTKIAVWSNDHNVDPVGACVGARGGRVRMVVNEMRGEKIDIVPFSEDLADFVAKALSPAKVTQVNISDDGTAADVIVPDHQLSLAIGREGQNARLAARLTGVRVDIRSETQLAEGIPAGGRDADVEYADGEWRANAETGEMEWHAADGSVISESDWQAQAAEAAEAPATEATDAEPSPDGDAPADAVEADTATDAAAPAEGSASDEADAARGGSEADDEPATSEGSASDEADDDADQTEEEAKRTTSPPPRKALTAECRGSSRTRSNLHRLSSPTSAVGARARHEIVVGRYRRRWSERGSGRLVVSHRRRNSSRRPDVSRHRAHASGVRPGVAHRTRRTRPQRHPDRPHRW